MAIGNNLNSPSLSNLSHENSNTILLNNHLLDFVIQNISDPFFIYDIKGNLLKTNHAGRKLYPIQDIETIKSFSYQL